MCLTGTVHHYRVLEPMPAFVLTMSCPDRTGIVAGISTFIAERRGLIHEAAHFVDGYSNRSFMRTTFSGDTFPELTVLRTQFCDLALRFTMDWRLHAAECRAQGSGRRVQARSLPEQPAPSLEHGRAADRHRRRRLQPPDACAPGRVVWAAVSPPCRSRRTRDSRRRRCWAHRATTGADLLVLARYMQILSRAGLPSTAGPLHQHSSLVPAELQGREGRITRPMSAA